MDAFSEAFDERRQGRALHRILAIWGLSQTDAAAALGVSRTALSKWLLFDVPRERTVAVADLSAATDLLVRHISRDRIPAVVRRPATNLDGRSLVDLLQHSGAGAVLEACRGMFAFERAQG